VAKRYWKKELKLLITAIILTIPPPQVARSLEQDFLEEYLRIFQDLYGVFLFACLMKYNSPILSMEYS